MSCQVPTLCLQHVQQHFRVANAIESSIRLQNYNVKPPALLPLRTVYVPGVSINSYTMGLPERGDVCRQR